MCTFTFTGNVQVGFQLQIEYDILMYLKLNSTFKRNTELFAIDSPHVSLFYIRFFTLKKAFTPSHNARFAMSIIGFECEGLDFKVFTAQELIRPLIS